MELQEHFFNLSQSQFIMTNSLISSYGEDNFGDMLFSSCELFMNQDELGYIYPVDAVSDQSVLASQPYCSTVGENFGFNERNGDDDDSCDTRSTAVVDERGQTKRKKKKKRDRSKTLVSERKRRGRMKEKLYELRSLVPNITKMDKASIIADAVTYVQGLQKQANTLEQELALLESSTKNNTSELLEKYCEEVALVDETKNAISAKALKVYATELGERSFHVKVECSSNGDTAAASFLYSAIESLECFLLQNSTFSTVSEKLILSSTLKVRDFGEEVNATTAKLWVISALLKEGFDLDVTAIL